MKRLRLVVIKFLLSPLLQGYIVIFGELCKVEQEASLGYSETIVVVRAF